MLGSSVRATPSNTLVTTQARDVPDDIHFSLGDDKDTVLLNRSATLTANTTLAGVLEGTPVTPALAANSLIISNITNDGDILIAGSDGGNSKASLFFDSSAGDTYLFHVGGTWTAGASTWTLPAHVSGTISASTADGVDLGSTSAEFRSLYLGDNGKLYFGVGQDLAIYRIAAGRLGIIGTTPEAQRWIVGENPAEATKWIAAVQGTITDPTVDGHNWGFRSQVRFAATAAPITVTPTGLTTDVIIAPTNTQNYTAAILALDAYILADTDSTGTLSSLIAVSGNIHTKGCPVTNAYTFRAFAPAVTAPGTITNAYGIYIDEPTVGTNTNLSLYVAGDSQFIKNVRFDYPVSVYNSFIIQANNQGVYGNSTINNYYHLYGYDTDATAYQSALKITNAAIITAQFAADLQLGFFGATPVSQQTKAGHNNWATIGDVVNALVSLGLFDTA